MLLKLIDSEPCVHIAFQLLTLFFKHISNDYRYTYGDASARAMKLANVLTNVLDIKPVRH